MTSAYAPSILRKTLCHASRVYNNKAKQPMKHLYSKKLHATAVLMFAIALFAPRIGWGQSSYAFRYIKNDNTYGYTDYLSTAIGNAKNNSTIYVYDYGYNGVLSSSNNRIDLNKNITIKSSEPGTKRTIKRTGTNQWIRIYGSYTLTVEDIIFDGQNSSYSSSFSMIQGSNGANISMNRCEVNNCKKSANGEGSSNNGAGINISGTSSGLICTNVKFQNNINTETHSPIGNVVYGGGAVAIGGKASFSLTSCEFYGNQAYEGGGAIYMELAGTGLISGCTIGKSGSGNKAGIVGGGIYGNTNEGYIVTIDGTTRIEYNEVVVYDGNGSDKNYYGQGGGVYFINGKYTGDITIGDATGSNKVVISNNQARGGGGGVMFWCTATSSTVMRIQNFKMENNSSGNTTHNFYDPDYNYGGGGIFVVGNLDISHSANHIVIKDGTISDCYAIGYGGGLFINNHDCVVRNVTFKNNYTTNSSGAAGGLGGAVMVNGKASGSDYSHTDYFYNCEFYKNGIKKSNSSVMTTHGGALYSQNISNVQMLGCTVGDYDEDDEESRGNKATRNGGGICIEANSYLTLDSYSGKRGIVSYNQAADGGGIYVASGSQGHTNIGFNSSDYPVEICNNQAAMFGGGIYLDCAGHPDDQFSLQNFKLNENTALHGGGAYLHGGHVSGVNHKPMTIQNGTVQDNHASSMGGGIFFDEHDADVSNVYFIHNTTNTGTTPEATGIGGGVLIAGHSNHSVEDHDHDFTNCKFFQNEASYGGAAMVKRKTNADFINCTIGGSSTNKNTASIDGGGVYVEELSKAFFTSGTTISYNEAVDGGGIYVAGYEGSGTPNDYMNMVCEASVSVPNSSYGVYFGIYTKNGSTYNLVSGSSMTLMGTQSGVLRQTNLQRGVDYYVLSRPIPSDESMYMYPIECSMSGIDGKIQIYNASWSTFTEYTSNTWNKPAWTSLSSLAYATSYISGAYYYEIIHFRVIPDEDINASGYASLSGNTTVVANAASNDGGGIYIDNIGEVQLNGCTIGGSVNGKNTANNKGGGIYKLGTLKVQGTVNVTDNTSGTSGAKAVVLDNVYIPPASADDKTILIIGELFCGSSIGVTKTKKWMEPGTGTTNATSTEASPQYGSQGDHVYDMDDNFKQVRTAIAKVSPASSTENWALDAYKRNVFFDDKDNYHVWSFNYSKTNDLNNIKAYVDQSDYFIETWRNFASNTDPDDVTISSDFVTHVHSAPGLAYFAKHVNSGKDYESKSVIQTTDIDLSGHYWEPIGILYCGDCGAANKPFAGTFTGNGHITSGTMSILPVKGMGLFGNVSGTVKHTFAIEGDLTYTLVGSGGGLGGLVGNVASGGVIDGCESALFTLTGYSASCYAGGIAGMVAGEMRNSFAVGNTIATDTDSDTNITASGGMAGLVSGQVKNGYSINAGLAGSSQGALVGSNSGTLSNAYTNADSRSVVGSGSGTKTNIYSAGASGATYTYTPTITSNELGYMYSDNLVNGKPMFEELTSNAKNLGTEYDLWARPTLSEINGDLPVLMMDNYNSSGRIGLGGFRSLGNVKTQAENATNHAYVLQYSGPNRDDEGNTPSFTSPANPELDGALTRENSGKSLFIYGDITEAPTVSSTSITADKISVYEHSAILNPGTLSDYTNTYVGISFDNSSNGAWSTPQINHLDSQFLPRDWHMFSTPLANAPLGFDYTMMVGGQEVNTNLSQYYPDDPSGDEIDYGDYYNNPWPFLHSQTTNNTEFNWLNNGGTGDNRYWMKDYATVDGYFPTERGALFSTGENNADPKPSEVNNLFIAGSDEYPGTGRYRYPYGMDMYCWYEPEPHWVNFKRNGPNHWHSDEYDPANHLHAHLAYTEYNIAEGNDIPNQNEDDLVIGKGYMASISIATYMQSHGQLSKTNDNVALERTVTAKADGNIAGWNLVGNPFHAYLDFAKFANETGNENASSNYDLLAKEGNSPFYVVYDADKYESSPGSAFRYYPQGGSSGGDYAGRYLHPHQGFFVKVLSSSGTLKYDESMIVARSALDFDDDGLDGHFRNGHVDDGSPAYPLVNLYLSSERGCADITVIEFNRPEWNGAHKLKELRQGNGLFYGRHEGRNYAALFAKEGAERVPLWFEAKEHDVFTMKWNTANGDFLSMYLIDNLTGIKYNMLAHDSYTFEGNIQDYPSRFYITFKFNEGPQDEEEPEDDDGNTETHTQFAFLDGSQWVVTGEGIIDFIDLQGRVLLRTQVDGQSHVSLPNVTPGLYMFRLSSSHDVKVQKVIITNN